MTLYTYDDNGNLTKRRTPKGDDILFAYDPVNQLLNKTLPGSQLTSYQYHLVGNLTNVTDPEGEKIQHSVVLVFGGRSGSHMVAGLLTSCFPK